MAGTATPGRPRTAATETMRPKGEADTRAAKDDRDGDTNIKTDGRKMTKTDGSRLILFVKDSGGQWVTLAFATSLELEVRAETIAKAAGAGGGGWRHSKKRMRGWSVKVKHLMSEVRQKVEIEGLVASGNPVAVMIGLVAPGWFSYAEVEATEAWVTGDAIFERMSVTGQQGAFAVMDVSLRGNGALEDAEDEGAE